VRFGVAKYALLAFIAVVLTGWTLALAGCGDDDDDGGSSAAESDMLQSLGKGEGEVDMIVWSGYAEDGSTDPDVDWVTPFEKKTGCQVNQKVGNTSDEMVTLMRTGNYDTVSASGDATLRLVAGGDVDPVNVDLVPNYKDIFPALKDQPHNTVDGVHYGIPHGRGANLLMWNTDEIKGNLDSWAEVFDNSDKYKGKVTAYDSPIYIADAAIYLKSARPELGIENPYELDEDQFNAAVDLLKQQRENIGDYWFAYTEEQNGFANGDLNIGQAWQYTANLLTDADVPVKTTLPKEGSTGWSDTWMLSSEAKHPNCAYMWMDWIVSPEANAEVAEWFGEAPSNSKSCALTAQKDFCEVYHADDEAYFDRVSYWTTPQADCGDDRGAVCKDYSEWVQAWTEVKG